MYPEVSRLDTLAGWRGRLTYAYGGSADPMTSRGLLRTMTDARGGTFTYYHDGRGRVERLLYPNGVSAWFGYYPDNALHTIAHIGAGPLFADSVYRDAAGNVIRRLNQLDGVPYRIEYTYDAWGQMLTMESNQVGEWRRSKYSYNGYGDRDLEEYYKGASRSNMELMGERQHEYGTGRRLEIVRNAMELSVSLMQQHFHDDGSLRLRLGVVFPVTAPIDSARFVANRYLYVGSGRMVAYESRTGGETTELEYDALGRRVREFTAGTERRFLYVGDQLSMVLRFASSHEPGSAQRTTGALTHAMAYAAEPGALTPIGRIASCPAWSCERVGAYYHRDHLGSVAHISRDDSPYPLNEVSSNIQAGYGAAAGPDTSEADRHAAKCVSQPCVSGAR